MFSLLDWAVLSAERDLVRKEARFCKSLRERVGRFGDKVCFSTIPTTVIPAKVVAALRPNRK